MFQLFLNDVAYFTDHNGAALLLIWEGWLRYCNEEYVMRKHISNLKYILLPCLHLNEIIGFKLLLHQITIVAL